MNKVVIVKETPNLLELIEACPPYGSEMVGIDMGVVFDGISDGIPDRIEPSTFADGPALSVCADGVEPSDFALKTDIEQVGTTVYGLPLYHFRYKTGPEYFQGVMAQDVLEVMPDAVVTGENGFYRVKYGQLGIRMIQT